MPWPFTLAVFFDDDVQWTCVVTSSVDPSLKVPVAVSCDVCPMASVTVDGVTAIDERVAFDTVRVVDPWTPEKVAEMVVVPTATPVARPWLPAALEIVAAAVLDEAQVTWVVRLCVVASLNRPVAWNWSR